RFQSFGFEVIAIDGHDLAQIDKAFDSATKNANGKPHAIIAKTFKGKGISFLENKDGWHGKALKKDELQKALTELGNPDDNLRFNLKKPSQTKLPGDVNIEAVTEMRFEKSKEYATREVFGQMLAKIGEKNKDIYA